MQPKNQGSSMHQPNNADTIYARLNEMLAVSGKILGISNNPSIAYQHSVASNCLREHMGNLSIHPITLEIVGNASSPTTTNQTYLYRIAATLHEELKALTCNCDKKIK